MLAPYHRKFLRHLLANNVRFIIVGGQARRIINPSHHTIDLDIWARLSDDCDKLKLARALVAWINEHPQHSSINIAQSLDLRHNCQIHFPEFDGVCFLDDSHLIQRIDAADGVDLLTSIAGLDFDDCVTRATSIEIEDIRVISLAAADLHRAIEARS